MLNNLIIIIPILIISILIFIFFIIKPQYLIYLIAFIIPFRFSFSNLENFDLRLPDLIFIVWIFVWLILFIMRKVKLNNIITQKKIILFLIYCIISFLIGSLNCFNIEGLIELFRLTMVILVGITLVTMFNNKKDFINFFYFWILGALISSIYSIVYFYQQGFDFNQIFTVSNDSIKQFYDMKFSSSPLFEDPNNFASYLLISILITIGVKKYNYINKNNKKSITICLVIQVLALIITLSRSAYIGLVIAILVNLTLDKKFKVLKGILFFLLMIAIILGAINIFNTDYSAMSRIALWETAVNMSINNPIFGVGLANFPIYFLKYLKGNILMMNPHPHNLFLRISAETGIVGLFLFINIYLEPIKNFLFYKNKKNINYNLQRYLILGMIAFFVQSIGVEYLASRHFWIVTSLILLNEKLKIA